MPTASPAKKLLLHAFTETQHIGHASRDDAAHLQAIQERSKSGHYALRDLMMNFILSDLFIKR